jgi:hypothetical protein
MLMPATAALNIALTKKSPPPRPLTKSRHFVQLATLTCITSSSYRNCCKQYSVALLFQDSRRPEPQRINNMTQQKSGKMYQERGAREARAARRRATDQRNKNLHTHLHYTHSYTHRVKAIIALARMERTDKFSSESSRWFTTPRSPADSAGRSTSSRTRASRKIDAAHSHLLRLPKTPTAVRLASTS